MTTSNRVSLEQNPNGAKWDRCLTDSIVKTGWFLSRKNCRWTIE